MRIIKWFKKQIGSQQFLLIAKFLVTCIASLVDSGLGFIVGFILLCWDLWFSR
jgi:hypothetical protein